MPQRGRGKKLRGTTGGRANRALLIVAATVCLGLVAALAAVGAAVVPGLLAGDVPSVAEIRSASDGGLVTFSWDDPGTESGDQYLVQVEDGESRLQRDTSVSLDAVPGGDACVTVRVQRGESISVPARSCVSVADGVD